MAVDADPLPGLVRRQNLEALRRSILALPVKYREAVVLCDLEELELRGRGGGAPLRDRHGAIAPAPRPDAAGPPPSRRGHAGVSCAVAQVDCMNHSRFESDRAISESLRRLAAETDVPDWNPSSERALLAAFDVARSRRPRRRAWIAYSAAAAAVAIAAVALTTLSKHEPNRVTTTAGISVTQPRIAPTQVVTAAAIGLSGKQSLFGARRAAACVRHVRRRSPLAAGRDDCRRSKAASSCGSYLPASTASA